MAIRGTCGVRKIRWADTGRGKRGGVRIYYYYRPAKDRIYLITVFDKAEKEDLSQAEKTQLCAVIAQLD